MRFAACLRTLGAIGLLCFQTAVAGATPDTGIWWNRNQSGRGFSIEVQGNTLFLGAFLYDTSGRSTWYATAGGIPSNGIYSGTLQSYGQGQTLTGAYKPPTVTNPNAGNVTLQFSDATHGTLTWPGGSVALERFTFGSGTPSFKPDTGIWWNAMENGRGYLIDVQGSTLWMGGYMYDSAGNPVWYSTSGPMTSTTLYQGHWDQYSGGQTLTGAYKAPGAPTNTGTIKLQFNSTTTAALTMPDGRQIPLARYMFGPGTPDGILNGRSPDQDKFIAARGYPHVFTIQFVTETMSGGKVVALTPPRRVETWIYNDANVVSAVFDNGFFISETKLGAHTSFQSTNLKPEYFTLGMTEAQVTSMVGKPTCVDTVQLPGMSLRFLRYAATGDSPVASVGLIDGQLASVSAGFMLSDKANPGTNLCSPPS